MASPGTPDMDKKYDIGGDVDRLENAPGPKSLEERQAQLKAALEVDPGVQAWSRAAFYVCSCYFRTFMQR
jgi:hypothetical protein